MTGIEEEGYYIDTGHVTVFAVQAGHVIVFAVQYSKQWQVNRY